MDAVTTKSPHNAEIARMLARVADLLEAEDANPFRVMSYRRAAAHVARTPEDLHALVSQRGTDGLRSIEGIGEGLAHAIAEIVETGRLRLLDRLEEQVAPERLLQRVPGVGAKLAHRIHDELGITSLEDLEQAAHDGRLARVEGVGTRRADGIRFALAGMLGTRTGRSTRPVALQPSIQTLLAVDAMYRASAQRDELPKITPRRFNPKHERWLPILRVDRDGWSFTALFSNTLRAHELGRTHDWVVIYYHRDGNDGQCTIVTAARGPLAGSRVVRGREGECRALAETTV
jgi:predicted flap endonuclease-1-like 5' DNA nuclease